ncbi:hypothetical protein Tco_0769592 [Tanacetum coccineum]|uniref:Uncharacterized protein n=1 Tax=Tanacetum coccineum TaxID=301880 RepID=A0ABQ4ZCF1_9ASTR
MLRSIITYSLLAGNSRCSDGGVKPSANKDSVAPSVTVAFGDSSSSQDKNSLKAGQDNLHDVNVRETPSNFTVDPNKGTCYANLFTCESTRKALNFQILFTPRANGVDVVVSVESIRAINEQFFNTAYGFFLGKRVSYPVVANYVRNTWGKYGLVKSMLNSSTGIFSFQFSSMRVWMRCLKIVYGLFATTHLSRKSGIRMSSYARALIEVRSDVELKDNIVSGILKRLGKDECPKNNRPMNNVSTSSNKKKDAEPTIEVSKSNSFNVLNSVENDVYLGTNRRTSNRLVKMLILVDPRFGMWILVVLVLPLVEKTDKIERLIIDGTATLVDDEGKLLTSFYSSGDHDSEDEVASVNNDMADFLVSKDVGYGTNSLLEQWKESYGNEEYDYDPYNDDMYEGHDIPSRFKIYVSNSLSHHEALERVIERMREKRQGDDIVLVSKSAEGLNNRLEKRKPRRQRLGSSEKD